MRRGTLGTFICVALSTALVASADDWPQWRGPQRDGVWRETGIVDRLPTKVKYRWRTKIGGGYAGPAVAKGRVYVADRVLSKGESVPTNPFNRRIIEGDERVLCLDEKTGNVLWSYRNTCRYNIQYAYGPRVTPTIADRKAYCVGAMGHMFCLDAQKGHVLWSKQFEKDYNASIPVWGAAAAPLIHGDHVILLVGGDKGAGVVCLNKDTGEEIWRALRLENPGYSSPMMVKVGGVEQLIVWTPKALYSLNPSNGKSHWTHAFNIKSGLSVASPIYDAATRRLFVSSFYNGSMMLELAAVKPIAKVIWKRSGSSERSTDALHCLMCTPVFSANHIYGVDAYGHLRCLLADTGDRKWETLKATGDGRWWNAFIVRHANNHILFNEQGDLIFAQLTTKGYKELSRTQLIRPTNSVRRRPIVWTHPAFANRCVYVRNDEEVVCVDLRK